MIDGCCYTCTKYEVLVLCFVVHVIAKRCNILSSRQPCFLAGSSWRCMRPISTRTGTLVFSKNSSNSIRDWNNYSSKI